MWRLGFVVLMVLGCGSVQLAPTPDVVDGSVVPSSRAETPDAGNDGATTNGAGGTGITRAEAGPPEFGTVDAGFDQTVSVSCDQRCAAWCAAGKVGSLVGCGCGC